MKAARLPKAKVQILAASNSNETNKDLKLSVQISDIPQLTAGDKADVLLAITESNLRSEVSRGENAGRYLRHSAVVRSLAVLGNINNGQQSFDAESQRVSKLAGNGIICARSCSYRNGGPVAFSVPQCWDLPKIRVGSIRQSGEGLVISERSKQYGVLKRRKYGWRKINRDLSSSYRHRGL